MRITITKYPFDREPITFDRGITKEHRARACSMIVQQVRPCYTPESKQRAKEYARSQA